MTIEGVKPAERTSSTSSWFPSKKVILAGLLLLTVVGVFLTSFTGLGQRSALAGRQWASTILAASRDETESGVRRLVLAPIATTVCNNSNSTIGGGGGQNGTGTDPQAAAGCVSVEQGASVNSSSAATPPSVKKNNGSPPLPLLGPGQTHLTFNRSAVMQCPLDSPFIVCGGVPAPRTPEEQAADAARRPGGRPWKVANVRMPKWAPEVTFERCRYRNCVAGAANTPDTDLVHVYGVGLNAAGFPRPARYGNQSWMFSVWESPHHTHADFLSNENSVWNTAFNFTMSYRVDSDVFVPYGRLAFDPTPLEKRPNYYEIAKGKTRSVAWFVSNCRTPSKRQEYVQELKKYIDVDVFGACGIPCRKKDGQCMKDLPVKYKFYLSFENSICTDYISEKLYKIYSAGMHVIPVTRGGTQYAKYFPENTFIDAGDFSSPRLLAEHLKALGSDLERYSQMLEFKDQYRWFGGLDAMWCRLCEALNTRGLPQKTYNMKKWFKDGHCKQVNPYRR